MFNPAYIVRPNIKTLSPYSSARDEYNGGKAVFLDANENPFGSLNRYPDPYQSELKNLLAKNKGLKPENIFVGNGSDEIIDLSFRIFCEPAYDRALTISPTYGMYRVSAEINNIELISIPLNSDFDIQKGSFDTFLAQADIKLIIFCSPNNPTANSLNRSEIKRITKAFPGIVLIDEAYIDFSSEDSWINELNNYPNLIVCQTFSKAFGLAAARVGTAYASKEIVEIYSRVKPPYNVSSNNQQAAIDALNNAKDFKRNLNEILENKVVLLNQLNALKCVEKIYPSDSNFLLVQFDDADNIYSILLKEGIVVRNRSKQVKSCLRITVGNTDENRKLIDALKNNES